MFYWTLTFLFDVTSFGYFYLCPLLAGGNGSICTEARILDRKLIPTGREAENKLGICRGRGTTLHQAAVEVVSAEEEEEEVGLGRRES